jgi:hypothetical protein
MHLEFNSGGELPETLKGLFTNKRVMEEAVERYLREKREEKAPKRNTVAKEVA